MVQPRLARLSLRKVSERQVWATISAAKFLNTLPTFAASLLLVLVSTWEPSPTTPKISFLLPTAPSLAKPTVEAWRHYPPGTTQSSPTHLIFPLQQSRASTYSHCMEKELQRRHKLSQFLCQDRGWPRPLLCLALGLITPLCVPYSMMSHVFSQWALATKIQTYHLHFGS